MKRILLILAACACACASAGVMSARLGALGRNDTVVTNVTDVTPGNYETVSNRAMSARSMTDLGVRGAPQGEGSWFTVNGKILEWNEGAWGDENQVIDNYGEHYFFFGEGEADVYLDENFSCSINFGTNTYIIIGYTNTLAQVSQIPNVAGVATASTNYTDAVAARKQDALPYPTNAIPFSAIDGAPSGGGTPEWEERTIDSLTSDVAYVTNGMLNVMVDTMISVSTNGWPNGASMFVRFDTGGRSYTFEGSVPRLVGYGMWPTNNFQSVWWRSGTNVYVNILVEE